MHESSDTPSASAAIADLAIPRQASVTAAPDDSCPVQWRGRQAVVTLPGYIDASNASQIGEELHSLINGGATELIADMTATVSCDHSGADAMAHAYRHALINGTQLRLVVTAQIVQRVLTLNGLDRLIPVYHFRAAAIAAGCQQRRSGDTQAGRPARGATEKPDGTTALEADVKTRDRPARDWTAVLRRRPARIVAGRPEGGHTNVFESICCDCGDQPDLDYREVPPELQRTRGPYPITAGVTAYEKPLRLHRSPARQTSPGWHA